MKEYIFFDLDGTLTDPALGITNSLIYALEKLGINVSNREELYPFIGPPLVDKLMEVYGFDIEKATEGLMYYREYFKEKGIFENTVYEGIPEMLQNLKKRGYKLVLATSKPEEFAKQILDYFDLSKFFDFVGGNNLKEERPFKAAVIEYDMLMLDIHDVSNCIMVGDREHDVIGAKKIGMECVGVLFGYGTKDELEKAGADYIVESISDLNSHLNNI